MIVPSFVRKAASEMFKATCMSNMNNFSAVQSADFSSRRNGSLAIIIMDTVISVSISFALALISVIGIWSIIIIEKFKAFTSGSVF